mmetsp:Transcript_17490/g.52597  ORF Transcript_17490/g.52597 Transcript_17490/m.52597 type:complete len:288 (-) Transcript_17490:1282-2145(-)
MRPYSGSRRALDARAVLAMPSHCDALPPPTRSPRPGETGTSSRGSPHMSLDGEVFVCGVSAIRSNMAVCPAPDSAAAVAWLRVRPLPRSDCGEGAGRFGAGVEGAAVANALEMERSLTRPSGVGMPPRPRCLEVARAAELVDPRRQGMSGGGPMARLAWWPAGADRSVRRFSTTELPIIARGSGFWPLAGFAAAVSICISASRVLPLSPPSSERGGTGGCASALPARRAVCAAARRRFCAVRCACASVATLGRPSCVHTRVSSSESSGRPVWSSTTLLSAAKGTSAT